MPGPLLAASLRWAWSWQTLSRAAYTENLTWVSEQFLNTGGVLSLVAVIVGQNLPTRQPPPPPALQLHFCLCFCARAVGATSTPCPGLSLPHVSPGPSICSEPLLQQSLPSLVSPGFLSTESCPSLDKYFVNPENKTEQNKTP